MDGTGFHFSQQFAGVDGTGFHFSQQFAGVDGTGFHFSQQFAGEDGTGFHLSQQFAGVDGTGFHLSQQFAGVDGTGFHLSQQFAGGDGTGFYFSGTPLSCSSAIEIASRHFEDLVEDQGFLDTEKQWSKMLALLPEKKRQLLQEEWRERPQDSGTTRWRRLVNEAVRNKKIGFVTPAVVLLSYCAGDEDKE